MSITTFILLFTIGLSLGALNSDRLFSRLLLNPYLVFERKEFWRLLTSGFVHGGYAHLGFNMFTFYFFGALVEETFMRLEGADTGRYTFLIFYLTAIILSDIPSLFKYRNIPGYNSLGASGAVSAIVFCSILYFPTNKIYLFGLFGLPGFLLGAFYIIYSYYQGKSMSDNINHEAHLYGAIYGMVFGLWRYPEAGLSFFEQIGQYKFF